MRRYPSKIIASYFSHIADNEQLRANNQFNKNRALHEECGVFGIAFHPDAASITALGLHSLQHRGQESAGIASTDGEKFHIHREQGLVSKVFGKKTKLDKLHGDLALGHNRYATTGEKSSCNIQPFFADIRGNGVAIAHNGQLTNYYQLKNELENTGCIFQSTSDSELFLQLAARQSGKDNVTRFFNSLPLVIGGFSLVVMNNKCMMGARDPLGIRPLIYGELDGCPVLVSETCALDAIGAKFIREIKPGEFIIFTRNKKPISKFFCTKSQQEKLCVFELIYFSKPNSIVNGCSIYSLRKNLGKELAKEINIKADMVSPIPDSGVPAAIGFATGSGIDYDMALIRGHFIGRTFIEPNQLERELAVARKHMPNKSIIKGKDLILIDDSIVRGTTIKKIISILRQAGAGKIHICIAAPPIRYPDFYGINTPSSDELIAANHSIEETCKIIGADTLHYLSLEGLYNAINNTKSLDKNHSNSSLNSNQNKHTNDHKLKNITSIYGSNFISDHCFTGNYPTSLPDRDNKDVIIPRQLSLLHLVNEN